MPLANESRNHHATSIPFPRLLRLLVPPCFLLGIACGDAGDDASLDTDADVDESLDAARRGDSRRHRIPWRRHHEPPRDGGGSNGGSSSGGPNAATCAVCTKAQACCNEVSGGPLCKYSAATCSSLNEASRSGYVSACLMLLDTVDRAWSNAPPAACR